MANTIKASINNNPLNTKSAVTSILSINEMNYQPLIKNHEATTIPKKLIQAVSCPSNDNQEVVSSESRLTLTAALRNALINKDTDSFLFCLEQKDMVLIENTIKGMDENAIKMFIEKLIDLFQRSMIYKLNIIPWMSVIIKYHQFIILSMSNDVIQNLNKIKALIDNYTRNYSKLIQLKKKLDDFNAQGKDKGKGKEENQKDNSKGKIEPLLVYVESDDEEEKAKKKKKKEALNENGIELYDDEDDNDDKDIDIDNIIADGDEEEDDYFDIEGDYEEKEDNDSEDNYTKGKKVISKIEKDAEDNEDEDYAQDSN